MPEFTRVSSKATGHHFSVAVVDPERHRVLKQDALDTEGRPRPAQHKTSLAAEPGTAREATNDKADQAKED